MRSAPARAFARRMGSLSLCACIAAMASSTAHGQPAPAVSGAAPVPAAFGSGAGWVDARVSQLRSRAISASGPLAYVALRDLWAAWDDADPDQVEEAIHAVATAPSQAAPVRAYAALLEAYARRRRGDLDGARSRIARLGFVGRWLMIGPFDNDGKMGLAAKLDIEAEEPRPLNVTRDYEGKDNRSVRWRLLPAVSPYAWVDFGAFVRPTENVCVYATTFVRDAHLKDGQSRSVSIWAGSTGALRVSWNGAVVLEDGKYRDIDSDRLAARLSLASGWNRLTAKICSDERAPMLTLRVAGAAGEPDDKLEVDADPRHSTRQEAAAVSPGGARSSVPGDVEGPLQGFERLARAGDPAVLEGFARYLETTGADDPTERRARELARKAADKAPTVSRLLLAARVAESRDQRSAWIDRAEALVSAGRARMTDRVDALLARADYLRTGVNPREAMALYAQALAIDPDNAPARLGELDLYEDAGMHETGMVAIEDALAIRPRSVGLLRAMVAALRQEGREWEADRVADVYSALRFDDPTFLRSRLDLAVARRDVAGASKWMDRLLAINPDSTAAMQIAAQAWLRLGDRARAVAAYRTALEMAPDDTDLMRQLATVYGYEGERDEQLKLLQGVLVRAPQSKDVREELAHLGPPMLRPDERYARPASEFLAQRRRDGAGHDRRSLVDLQVTTVFPNGLASRFHQVVYQPLTDAAAARSREYEFSYESDSQTVQLRAARVYRSDGRIDDAVANGAGGMADDPELAIYTTTRSYYVRFPRLEPGDVVELQYRVEDVAPRNAFADYFGEVVYLQGPEPIALAEYVLITPQSRTFYFNEPRVPGLRRTVEQRGDQRVYDFAAADVPALAPETLQPPWTEVLGHVHVSTYKSWDDMGRWYWGLVHDQLVPDDEVRRRADALTRGLKDDEAKVRAIYDYVVQKTRYVALEFGIHGYKPYRCAQIFARGFGDCKDKATLIVTMLNALGIKAIPVIVRSGAKGDIETAPASLAPFDHMIAFVPSLALYLDGTAEYTGSRELPAMDRGALALQVDESEIKLVHLPQPPANESVSNHVVDASLGADGSAQLDWRAEITGVEAAEWRVRFHADSTRKQRVQQLVASMLPGGEVTSVEAGDLEDVEQPVKLRVRGRVPQFAHIAGDTVTVPLGRKEHMVRDYAPRADRRLDLRLSAQETERDEWTVRLPPGAKIKSLPSAAKGSSRFGAYEAEVTTEAGVLHAKTTVVLQTTRVPVSEYPAFRAWCEEVDRALGQQAMLEIK